MDEQMKPRKLRISQIEDVTMSALEEQIKAEELRLVIAMQYV
jgi:hypothetical protein